MALAAVRTPGPRLNLTFAEAGHLLGVSRWTIHREIAAGKLRVVKLRGAVRIPRVEIDRYQRALYKAAIAAAPETREVDDQEAS